jgi:hypothetical protein
MPLESLDLLPSARLQEAIPFIAASRGGLRNETSIPAQRLRTAPRQVPVTINVESVSEETDLRELTKKITRMLRDEARRYGLY